MKSIKTDNLDKALKESKAALFAANTAMNVSENTFFILIHPVTSRCVVFDILAIIIIITLPV